MAVETDADRQDMLEDFGEEWTLDGVTIEKAIFDDAFAMAEVGGLRVESNEPRLLTRASDLTGVTNEGVATDGVRSYVIRRIEPDGAGMAIVILSEAT